MEMADIITAVTSWVTASIGWITSFVGEITSQPLLLAFCIIAFIGTGVGLIKRLIRL